MMQRELMARCSKRVALLCVLTAAAAGTGAPRAGEADRNLADLTLEELMNESVTSASKRQTRLGDAPTAISVITQEDIRRSGYNSIPELLRLVPGLNVARIDGNEWAVSSRGFNSQYANKLLVLIDGRTVYTPSSAGVYWNVQDTMLEDIDRIEVIRGPGATLQAERPYAMAFVDMRMPPGLDGVETIERLWNEDPQLQIVVCTAYSDYSWMEVLSRLAVRDRLLILKKPFDPIEAYQFANSLTAKWNLSRQAAFKMDTLERAVEERTRQLSDANIIVQNNPVILYRLRGEPSFPLVYVSHNITKLGHDPDALLESPDWARRLIHPDDQAKVGEAMARVLQKDAQGASIEFRLGTAEGSWRWVENRYVPVRNKEGRLVEVEGIIIDITERKAAEEQIALLARTDGLTGLANRAIFMERLRHVFAACGRGAKPFAILYLDLDRFKPVNDTLGHPAGDLLLQEVAARLRDCVRDSDLIARLGGDEFALLQCEIREPANAGELASKIQSALARPYSLNGNEVNVSVSIGICPFEPDIADADAMLAQADRALYRSKEKGRNCYHFHSDDLDQDWSASRWATNCAARSNRASSSCNINRRWSCAVKPS